MMNMNGAITSSSAWLRGVMLLFESQGIEVGSLFHDAGLDPERLKLPHARFSLKDVSRLWTLAVSRSGQSSLGLDRQLALRFVNFDIAAQAMWPSPSLGGGLESLSRYLILLGDSAGFTVHRDRWGSWLVLKHGSDGTIPRQRIEYGMLALLMLCQRVTRSALRPLAADFVFSEPADFHAHRMAFQCPIRFGQAANRLHLRHDDLASPLVSKSESLFTLQERVIENRLARLGGSRDSYRASEEIIRSLHLGQPSREQVARSLGLTGAALERHLKGEGLTYVALVDDVRKELAAQYLAQPSYALVRIAGLLGWRSATELAEACQRWWGLQPSQCRQRFAGEQGTS